MHAQRNFSRRVVKFAPEGNLQGFQILYIQVLINMEPCTLLGEFLLGEREEYAFSGPQVRACREQQPGALSSKWVLQPLLTQALERRQHSNLASRWPVLHGSAAMRWRSPKTWCFQRPGRCRQYPTQEAEEEFYADPARNIQEITAFAGSN